MVDLVDKMFVFDSARRIIVEEALAYLYLESFYDEVDELCVELLFIFDFEDGV